MSTINSIPILLVVMAGGGRLTSYLWNIGVSEHPVFTKMSWPNNVSTIQSMHALIWPGCKVFVHLFCSGNPPIPEGIAAEHCLTGWTDGKLFHPAEYLQDDHQSETDKSKKFSEAALDTCDSFWSFLYSWNPILCRLNCSHLELVCLISKCCF